MRVLFILLIAVCIFCFTISRPLQKSEIESQTNDLDPEDDTEVGADSSNNENSNAQLKQKLVNEENSEENREDLFENSYQESNADASFEADANLFSDKKPNNKNSNSEKSSEGSNSNNKIESNSYRRTSNKFTENSDLNQQLEPVQRFTHRDFKFFNPIRNLHNRRTLHTPPVDKNARIKNSNEIYNYEDKYRSNNNEFDQSSHFCQYENIKNENTRIDSDTKRNILNRDRRELETKQNSEGLTNDKNDNEYPKQTSKVDEELAIKEHVKKLSEPELVELLNSLTEEKQELLKKIMDEDNINNPMGENVNKREISKKAEAVEDNNFIDNVQLDINKLQGSSLADINTESGSHNIVTTTFPTKQTENSDKVDETTSKTSGTNSGLETKSDLASQSFETKKVLLFNNLNSGVSGPDINNKAEVASNQEISAKSDTKREANLDETEDDDVTFEDLNIVENNYYNDKNALDASLGEEYYSNCILDENIAKMNDDDLQTLNEKPYKRDVAEKQSETLDSIKALEESFPNSKNVVNSGPLIRVKRTDLSKHNITKRSANSKIGYYPHGAENVDEEYEEGSEFDDDGFYDRTSNINNENKHGNKLYNSFESEQSLKRDRNLKFDNLNIDANIASNEKETVELGSDTDSVLLGVEGVDENLMFSSNLRNKRSLEVKLSNMTNETRPTSLTNIHIKSESNFNASNLSETDALNPTQCDCKCNKLIGIKNTHFSKKYTTDSS